MVEEGGKHRHIYLFDSSAIFEAVMEMGSRPYPCWRDNTDQPSVLRVGQRPLEKKIDVGVVLDALNDVISTMKVMDVKLDRELMEEAARNGLTYYDASYLVTSTRTNATLVTLDEELLRLGARDLREILR